MHRKLEPALIVPLVATTACATAADDASVEVRPFTDVLGEAGGDGEEAL